LAGFNLVYLVELPDEQV